MNRTLLQAVVRHAESLAAEPAAGIADQLLLRKFVDENDQAAFAELLRRHGPMVWAVCRHLLAQSSDAEDAFQATFLALVRSAARIRQGSAVGAWLHGVAVRAATRLKRSAVRSRQRERKAAVGEADRPVPDSNWNELLAAVHEEVQQLPEGDRIAFVLCDLEGLRQPDAAIRLGWKPGTLTGRLARARKALVERLSRRGIAPATAAGSLGLGAATAAAIVPAALTDRLLTSIGSGASDVSPALLQLALEVTPMSVNRTKLLAAAVVITGGLALTLGSAGLPVAEAQPPGPLPGGTPPTGSGSGLPPSGVPGLPPATDPSVPAGNADGPGVGLPQVGAGLGSPDSGGGPSLGAPASEKHPAVEYKFAGKPRTALEFGKLLADYGSEGWVFAGLVDYDRAEQQNAARANPTRFSSMRGETSSIVIFRRSVQPAVAVNPLRPVHGGLPGGSDLGPPAAGGRSGPVIGLSRGPIGPSPGGDPRGFGSYFPAPSSADGTGPMPPGQIKVIALKHAQANRMASTLMQVFTNEVVHLVADDHTNSLIVRADEATHAAVAALIQKLDVATDSGGSRPAKR